MKEKIFYPSSNGIDQIEANIWHCENPKFILQIAHGMSEHIDRYDEFAEFLNSHNIVVCANNHLGHGNTAKVLGDYGTGKFKYVIEDMHTLSNLIKNKYDLDLYYLGHSMGSFIIRYYMSIYPTKKCVVMGTGIHLKSVGSLLVRLSKFFMKKYSDQHISPLMTYFSTGRFDKLSGGVYNWISFNGAVIDKYKHDNLCGFPFTARGFNCLGQTIYRCSDWKNINKTDKNTEIFFVSGDSDPVGQNGKGIIKVYDKYKSLGYSKISYKIYEHMKHEILNEDKKELVYNDILNFLEN